MTNEQQQVKTWMKIFDQETPDKPCIPDLATRKLRAKMTLEEALETCHALNMHPYVRRTLNEDDMIELDDIGFWEDPKQQVSLKDIADGDADQRVVGAGTMAACGLIERRTIGLIVDPTDPLFNEVMRSNYTKLWTDKECFDNYPMFQTLGYITKQIEENKWLVKDRDGKVVKSPSYSPANLQPIIDEMSK